MQYQSNASHDGYTSSSGPTHGGVVWTYPIGGSPDGVIVVGSIVIVGNPNSGVMQGLSSTSGSMLFNYGISRCGGWIGDVTTYPASDGNLVYFYDGSGYCGDFILGDYVSTGSNAWKFGVTNPLHSSLQGGGMPMYANGVLYYAGYGLPQVYALSVDSGTQVWTTTRSDQISSVPTLGGNLLLLTFVNSHAVEALDTRNGNSVWNFTTDGQVIGGASYSQGTFFFGTISGTLYAVTSSGVEKWSVPLQSSIESTPAVANGQVFVTTTGSTLYALNGNTGSTNWNFTTASSIAAPPVIAGNDVVYVADVSGTIYGVSGTGGVRICEFHAGAAIATGLAIGDGYLFAVDTGGTVYAFANEYSVTFNESGLPTPSTWNVTFGTTTLSSTSGSVAFQVENGTYSYSVGAPLGYSPSPASGKVRVAGNNIDITIMFTKTSATVTFIESGLMSGLTWSVTVDGNELTSPTNSIVFEEISNGLHSFVVGVLSGYAASPARGNLSVSGRNVNISISFGPGWSPPSPPKNATATGAIGFIRLTWAPPQTTGAPPGFTGSGIEYYYVYRGNSSGNERYYDRVSGTTLSYTDSGAVAGKIYFYYVIATNPMGQSSPSLEVSAQAVFLTVPSIVQSVVATTEGSGIYLSWEPPASNGGTEITGYILCRGSTPATITNCIPRAANATSYHDTNNLSPGQTYYYTVKAANSQGQSDPSVPVQVTAPNTIPGIPFYKDSTDLAIIAIIATVVVGLGSTLLLRERRRPDLEIYIQKGEGWRTKQASGSIDIVVRNAGSDIATDVGMIIRNAQAKEIGKAEADSLEIHNVLRKTVELNLFPTSRCKVTVTYKHPSGKSRKVSKTLELPQPSQQLQDGA